ncbi:MAG: VOC family protein [Deltaproteobacteria bacterium]|nr:VOC family protein [Deltaproteobacteria bacterium]
MDINGIAHIQLTVTNLKKSLPFYKQLLEFFNMTRIFESDQYYYAVGGRTGVAISQASPDQADEKFVQTRVGLHHFCFRLRSREDVDLLHEFVKKTGAKIIRPPMQEDNWAPGYYSLLFEDPDGIRLEANFIPGKGNLDPKTQLPKKWDW